jgi:hypothetical protein
MTVYKAQGQTMKHIIAGLAECTGTEQPDVMVSRATSLDGLMVLRGFDAKQITKRRSEELRMEFDSSRILSGKSVANGSEVRSRR